jgi:hypothetical protein
MLHRMLSEANNASPETSELIKDLAAIVYLGGSDTTVAAVISFFLAMVIYPDVQRQAQAELDEVVGRDRLPDFGDKKHLPYVKAVMNECLRWLPVLPMGTLFFIAAHERPQTDRLQVHYRCSTLRYARRRVQRILHPEGIDSPSVAMGAATRSRALPQPGTVHARALSRTLALGCVDHTYGCP